ncbi:MAG: recombinase family protein [Zymomonas mobilis subsp. pomaceae]|uniref:Resolvase domain protein n=1 Tax=Zymomonas mobilis subsp. pomaceae (strain ATCC 29192 / DSM 22645 / JCM 10191 / CCUG 17912 / NBRC 13757 / NCIMB 11200 / NRRL B-4491 / Barker I) TaxID=579138 RepID=F8EUZ4_ZYMMT|nr:recombinase family protein [Zymomonas mobilis]AEI37282.1 Resolvase domain protein [Zymomonas mobilis subsp. pomaceae ATCC 29192]MDX5948651.1 recombinase family protein [Zymomonas mobilis subsp. pomaceae]GEB88456.1 resolvase [Zymomonas mobilis subsp. pomaceae]
MKIGYARVSTHEENLNFQIAALEAAGCEEIFTDKVSGIKAERPGLTEALNFMREGDKFIIWRLDRLARSLKELITLVERLKEHSILFESLSEKIDTASSSGGLIFHIFGAMAEFERNLIRERTQAGLKAARARGRLGGRPHTPEKKIKTAIDLYHNNPDLPIAEICKLSGVSRATLYRYLKTEKN